MDLIKRVKETIKKKELIKPQDHILAGVSGGPDSIALVCILQNIRHEFGFKLSVGHINHGLRKSSETDQVFVQKFCQRLGLDCFTSRLDIASRKQEGSLEEIARDERFRSLCQLAKKIKANTIALGHTQNDLAETVLMRILRGTGLLGLRGISPKHDRKGITIIRPLLETRRADIESFLRTRGILSRLDPTNRQTKFFRNKIRLRLLPLLKKQYNHNIEEVLTHLAHNSAADYDFLAEQAKKHYRKMIPTPRYQTKRLLPLAGLLKIHASMRRMILRLAIEELKNNGKPLSSRHIQEIESLMTIKPKGTVVDLPNDIKVTREATCIRLTIANKSIARDRKNAVCQDNTSHSNKKTTGKKCLNIKKNQL
ncbi:MAG: tRNA lysidine(34) synthetase TilS [Candidatus Omnitrophota bacterium]